MHSVGSEIFPENSGKNRIPGKKADNIHLITLKSYCINYIKIV